MDIAGVFDQSLDLAADQPFIICRNRQWSFAAFHALCTQVARTLPTTGRIACYLADSPQLVAIILGAGLAQNDLLILNRDYPAEDIDSHLQQLDCALLITDSSEFLDNASERANTHTAVLSVGAFMHDCESAQAIAEPKQHSGELLVMTSGTTGAAKCARYQWQDLLQQVAQRNDEPQRWLFAYRLNHFAGIAMLIHCLANRASLVIPSHPGVAEAISCIRDFSVSHVSSTPTFWRFALALLQRDNSLELEHITLGSEAVDDGILEELTALFPTARIVHIYASTEAGSCVSVSDGKAGLPLGILHRPDSAAVQFQVRDDELYIRSQHGMRGYLDDSNADSEGWRASGDLVEIRDERIYFLGRRSETINVGGVKVHPLTVEEVISTVEGVKLNRVYGKENPVVGEIVAVDVLAEEGLDTSTLEASIREACMVLARHARPRSIDFVDTIDTSNLKLLRRRQTKQE